MSWRKRRKLPTTIRVHIINDETVEVFGRRMNSEQKDKLKEFLKQSKRKLKYRICNKDAISLQKFAMDNGWEYEGIPIILLQLKDQLKVRKLSAFETKNKSNFMSLWNTLHTHQKEGVKQIVQYYKGRALLADDKGLQNSPRYRICVVLHNEGPVLIVCPST